MVPSYSDLNKARIEAVLAHRDELKAAMPGCEGVDTQLYRDFGALWELWGHVQSVPSTSTDDWVRAARAEINAQIETWRNWPVFDPTQVVSMAIAKLTEGGTTDATRAQL